MFEDQKRQEFLDNSTEEFGVCIALEMKSSEIIDPNDRIGMKIVILVHNVKVQLLFQPLMRLKAMLLEGVLVSLLAALGNNKDPEEEQRKFNN